MNVAFAILFSLFFFVISYPFAKNFQLNGYKILFQLKNYFSLSYEFKGKNKLVFTKRVVRLCVVYALILFALNLCLFVFIKIVWVPIILMIVEFVLLQMLFLIAALIMEPFEKLIKSCYIKKAKKILNKFKGTKIAITGSFGKSSTKSFLFNILKSRFKVLCTPKNFNTPMGLCRTARESLSDYYEVFIVEMGAKKRGDIKELMEMLKPKYGIMTAIGEQHLETFGDLENIKKTKFEMCEHMLKGGCVVFDCANDVTESLCQIYRGEKREVNKEKGFSYITNLKMSTSGCKFKLHLGCKDFDVKTKIIGKLLLNDLVAAASMAYLIGMDAKSIVDAMENIEPFPHRLQVIQTPYSTIIDDSYNSNYFGAEQALETLKMFKGKKIVITPGFVEQGAKQYEMNYKLGKLIAESCDEVIIMNKVNQTPIMKGILAGGKSEDKIYYAKTRQQQIELLQQLQEKGSVVLFENDLPDNFN